MLVEGDGGVGQDELAARIAAALPAGGRLEAITGEELTRENVSDLAADFLSFFKTFLLVFSGIALLVATFSIYNTFSILVAQRTRESALLRALGRAGARCWGRCWPRRAWWAWWRRSWAWPAGWPSPGC